MLGTASTILYPYIIPMLLGRTFDLFTAQVGVDIFPHEAIRTPIRIHRSYVTSDFRLIRNDTEARSFLGISEDVSLRVKSGVLKIGATGDYLKDVQKRDNYVEILVKSTYETFTETLHGSTNPIKDWDLLSPNYLGTHFVRSITYGGMLLASLRLYVGNTKEKESLEDYLTRHFKFNEIKVTLERDDDDTHFVTEMNSFENKLEKMMYDVKTTVGSDVSLRIKYYSTVTAPRVPQDIKSFLSVLEDFPFEAKKTNGGRGVPITVELIPLHELSSRMVALHPDSLLGGALNNLEEKFNDLLLTHNSIKLLSNNHISDYNKKCKVRDLGTEVHDKLDVFNQVIQHLDTASPEAIGLSERAIQAYEQKPETDSYFDRFKLLEEEVDQKEPDAITPTGEGHRALTTSGGGAVGEVLDAATVMQQFGYLAEMAMANGVCASVNKFSGSFITMRRNCSSADPVHRPCSTVCGQLQIGPNFNDRGECVGVVAAQLQTPNNLGAPAVGGTGEAIGAQTANLGRTACDRTACFKEYCCCRLSRFGNGIL
ncbi:uncharacterized protein [Littorina saxatilis]|uniref:uncharacterized protein n=1 Tax=Littorina saxatilis TaxID=31220 RepID=UPI0038B62248